MASGAMIAVLQLFLTPPAEATQVEDPVVAGPASDAAPLDDEVPEPAGLGLQRREQRRMSAATTLDLDDLWADYEEDVAEDGERRRFAEYVAGSYRVRRGLGIGLTAFGTALLGTSALWAYLAAVEELDYVPGVFVALSVVSAGAGITGIAIGARIWRRNQLRLNELKGAGFLAGGPRWGLRAAGPVMLPRGAGLGLSLAF
jgi:hypothetical protein